jgi:hypothetical protein
MALQSWRKAVPATPCRISGRMPTETAGGNTETPMLFALAKEISWND